MILLLACSGSPECEDDCDTGTPPVQGNDIDLDTFPPVVIATSPMAGDLAVPASLDTISVTFHKPMNQNGWSWVSSGDAAQPQLGTVSFTSDDTNTAVGVVVQADTTYQVGFNGVSYQDFVDRIGLAALAYPLAFHTGDGSDPTVLDGLPATVIASVPAAGERDVDPGLTRLQLTFSRDMNPLTSGWDELQDITSPRQGDEGFSDARTAWLDVELAPSTTYALGIDGFRGSDETLAAPWMLTFRTADP